jgi:hypothetical protein
MNVTRNPRAIALYSGTIGVFLESSDIQANTGHNLDLLHLCREWLLVNNAIFSRYDVRSELQLLPLPLATLCSEEEETRPPNVPDLVLNPEPYARETQNEDYHYSRLPVASVSTRSGGITGLLRSDPDIELLLFPVLYPRGEGNWKPARPELWRPMHDTFLQHIKMRINGILSHYREDHYYPFWAYQEIEARRIFYNKQRIISSLTKQTLDRRLPGMDLLQQSQYGNYSIINEKLTTTIPEVIRTGDTYFQFNEQKVKTMMSTFGTPTLFMTLTFSEAWPGYQSFLATTGSRNKLPSDRPWEAVQYYFERLHWLKKTLLNNQKSSGFGQLQESVQRQEFQLRGAIHSHCLLWCEKSIPELIRTSYIRADLPNPNIEPLLYKVVKKWQIHTCKSHICGGLNPATGQCKKGFPAPLSSITYQAEHQLRYTYKRLTEDDRWVVPYNAELILLWDAHCNVQYCTSTGLASYISKYVTKVEPKSVLNIRSTDYTTSHLLARRVGSMENMVLLLSHNIFQISRGIQYISTAIPTERYSTIKPVYLLLQDPENPYHWDTFDKYFARPRDLSTQSLTYFDYFQKYIVSKSRIKGRRIPLVDENGYFVYKRAKVCDISLA